MKIIPYIVFATVFSAFILSGCKNSEPETVKSSEKSISGLKIASLSSADVAFEAATGTYTVTVPGGTDPKAIAVDFTLPKGATCSPRPGTVQDYSQPVAYTVTAEDGSTQVFKVIVKIERSSAKNVLNLSIPNLTQKAISFDGTTFTYTIKSIVGTDFSSVPVTVAVSEGATIAPLSGTVVNLSRPVTFKVTAEDGSTRDYIVKTDLSVRIDRIEKEAADAPYILSFEYDAAGNLKSLNEKNFRHMYSEAIARNNNRSVVFTYDNQKRVTKAVTTYDDKAFREYYAEPYVYVYNNEVTYTGNNSLPSQIVKDYVYGRGVNYGYDPHTDTFKYNEAGFINEWTRRYRGSFQTSPQVKLLPGNQGYITVYKYSTNSSRYVTGCEVTNTRCETKEEAPCDNFSVANSFSITNIYPTYDFRAILPAQNLISILYSLPDGHTLKQLHINGAGLNNKYSSSVATTLTEEGYVKKIGEYTIYYK